MAPVLWISAGEGRHNKKDGKPHLWGISSLSLKIGCVLVWGFMRGQGEVGVFLFVGFFFLNLVGIQFLFDWLCWVGSLPACCEVFHGVAVVHWVKLGAWAGELCLPVLAVCILF